MAHLLTLVIVSQHPMILRQTMAVRMAFSKTRIVRTTLPGGAAISLLQHSGAAANPAMCVMLQ
jgi:hypothetical protein